MLARLTDSLTANRSRESEWAQNVMAFQRGLQDVSYSRGENGRPFVHKRH